MSARPSERSSVGQGVKFALRGDEDVGPRTRECPLDLIAVSTGTVDFVQGEAGERLRDLFRGGVEVREIG
ncbi:hypothetical protein ACVI1I_002704 [Bradyrhizobium sp. USDA 4459]